ncbi:MAG: hypothetical protein ACFFAJ_04760 [Candidatus Hodarchaeota archaeon]
MDERIIGSILIVVGLIIWGFGGTMSTAIQAIFYISGALLALVGGGFFAIHYRRKSERKEIQQ